MGQPPAADPAAADQPPPGRDADGCPQAPRAAPLASSGFDATFHAVILNEQLFAIHGFVAEAPADRERRRSARAISWTHSAAGTGPANRTYIRQEAIDEQAREASRRAGRATATPAVAWEAGWPAWPAVARQAGRTAPAEADHVADAARTGPLGSTSNKSALHQTMGRRFRFLVDAPAAAP